MSMFLNNLYYFRECFVAFEQLGDNYSSVFLLYQFVVHLMTYNNPSF